MIISSGTRASPRILRESHSEILSVIMQKLSLMWIDRDAWQAIPRSRLTVVMSYR